jgi:hypothetical protein
VYFLSGSPLWTPATCTEMNITEKEENNRPDFTKEELSLLSTSFPKIVHENHLMDSFEFLKDSTNKDTIHHRFDKLAPMAQVTCILCPCVLTFFFFSGFFLLTCLLECFSCSRLSLSWSI